MPNFILHFLLWNPSFTGPRSIGSIEVSIGSPVIGQSSLEKGIASGVYTSCSGAAQEVPIRHRERTKFFIYQTVPVGSAGVLAAIAAARISADIFSWSERARIA